MKKVKKGVKAAPAENAKAETAKAGFESPEAAKAVKDSATSDLAKKREELNKFLKDAGLKKGKDYSDDKKHGGVFKKLNSAIEALEKSRKAAVDFLKTNKPAKKGGVGRADTKHAYPADIMALTGEAQKEAKKKHRQKIRVLAKKAGVTVDIFITDPDKYMASIKSEKKAEKSEKKGEKKADVKPAKKGDKATEKKADAKASKKSEPEAPKKKLVKKAKMD